MFIQFTQPSFIHFPKQPYIWPERTRGVLAIKLSVSCTDSQSPMPKSSSAPRVNGSLAHSPPSSWRPSFSSADCREWGCSIRDDCTAVLSHSHQQFSRLGNSRKTSPRLIHTLFSIHANGKLEDSPSHPVNQNDSDAKVPLTYIIFHVTSQDKKQHVFFGGSSQVHSSYRFHSVTQEAKTVQFTSHTYFIQVEMFLKTPLFNNSNTLPSVKHCRKRKAKRSILMTCSPLM